jgi:hypothetical protein
LVNVRFPSSLSWP